MSFGALVGKGALRENSANLWNIPALGHQLPSVSGPRNLSCTNLRLFAERVQARRKCWRTRENTDVWQIGMSTAMIRRFSKISVFSGFGRAAARRTTPKLPRAISVVPNGGGGIFGVLNRGPNSGSWARGGEAHRAEAAARNQGRSK